MPAKTIYVLKFISGKYKGGEVPLPENREIIIGRSHNIDITLLEDMVSRKHARIYREGDHYVIEDLNSTNGTFVNGNRIKKQILKEGDRILIGTSMMKLVQVEEEEPTLVTTQHYSLNVGPNRKSINIKETVVPEIVTPPQMKGMVGSLSEIQLADLLQLFITNRKTGILLLKQEMFEGRIYLKEGSVLYATLSNRPEIDPIKALYKLLRWDKGTFEFIKQEVNEESFPTKIEIPFEMLIMEGMRIWDELKRIEPKLPPQDSYLKIKIPLESKLSELSPEELDIFQMILNYSYTVMELLDLSPYDEVMTANILLKLYENGYITLK